MTAAEPVRAKVDRDFIRKFEPRGPNPRSFFSGLGKGDPPLHDVVLGMLRFMRKQGLVDV